MTNAGASNPGPAGTTRASTQTQTARELSAAERTAFDALMRYDKRIADIAFYDEIHNYGNGTLVLAEVFWPPLKDKDLNDDPYEYQVLVRDGRGLVYDDFTQTFREGSRRAETISRLASPDVVTAMLTFVLVAAYICFAAIGSLSSGDISKDSSLASSTSGDAARVLGAALTTVLGFWFGRQSRVN